MSDSTSSPGDHEIETLRRKLQEAESTLKALLSGEVDAVMDERASSALMLKAAQESLRASEARFRTLVENSHDAIVLLGKDETVSYASPAIERILGFAPSELVGVSARSLVHPEDAEAVGALVARVLEHPRVPIRGSARLRHKQGGWRVMDGTMTNCLDDPNVRALVSNIHDVTEEQLARAAVRRREHEFYAVFDRAIDAMLIADETGTYVDANPSASELFGVPREQLVGRNVREFAEPGYDVAAAWRHFVAAGEGQGEFRLLRPDGTIRDTEFSASTLSEGRYLSVLRDATEKKRLGRQQAAQLAVTRALAAATSVEDTLGRVLAELCAELSCDAAVFWTPDDHGTLIAADVYPKEQAPLPTPALSPLSPTSQALPVSVWSSGTPRYRTDVPSPSDHDAATAGAGFAGALAFPLSADAGPRGEGVIEVLSKQPGPPDAELLSTLRQLGVYLGQFLRRTRAEQALRASEASLATAQAIAKLGSWDYHVATRQVLLSEQGYQIFGAEPGGAAPTVDIWLRCIHPDDRDKANVILEHLERGEAPPPLEYRIVRAGGQERIVQIQARASADGTGRRITGTIQDVTDRRRLEQQLLQAQKLEAVGRLAAGVAHDFNNVLTVIQSYTRFVSQVVDDEEAQSDLQAILDATKRAANLVAQLLAFSKQQVVRPRPVDLEETLRPLEKLLRRLLPESIEVHVALPEPETLVEIDPTQLDQIVLNIAVNARDAMPRGGRLDMRIGTEALDAEAAARLPDAELGAYVVLEMTDTGIGMSPDTLSRVFEPFFSTKGPTQGTGLGLSTVYGIVRQAGGHIEVDSEVGRGTTFRIRLPLLDRARAASTTGPPASTELRGTETVLLVEDDDALRRATARLLSRAGYRVLSARRGEDAAALAASHEGSIPLVLTDVIMPGMSGVDAYDSVKANRPETRVVYMSGYADTTIADYGILDGSVPFLAKPFSPEQLLRAVRTAIDTRAT